MRKKKQGHDFLDWTRRAGRNLEREEAMRRVIEAIPPGKVSTYGHVAAAAGYPGYHRQVVQLLRREGHLLPWQRVVGAGGEIKTRGDSHITQRHLLEQEGAIFKGNRVDMERSEYQFRTWEIWT